MKVLEERLKENYFNGVCPKCKGQLVQKTFQTDNEDEFNAGYIFCGQCGFRPKKVGPLTW